MKKNSTNLFLTILFSLAALTATADSILPEFKKLEDLNRRSRFPVGLNAYGFGPVGGVALTADWFVTPKFALELGGGFRDLNFNHAFTIGARYHFFGKTFLSLTPYVGIYTAFHYNNSTLQNNSLYIPVGIHKIKRNGWSWSVEAAFQRNTFFSNGFTGGFRIGYRFKKGNGNSK